MGLRLSLSELRLSLPTFNLLNFCRFHSALPVSLFLFSLDLLRIFLNHQRTHSGPPPGSVSICLEEMGVMKERERSMGRDK